ncbi:hypothetical protein D3C84_1123710 [compost metagenome]
MLGLRDAPRAEGAPEVIDFLLGLAVDLKRDCLAELEHWATVEAGETLSVELEADGHDRAFRAAMQIETGVAIVGRGGDF